MKYVSTKTYDVDQEFSCVFRQWRSRHSHRSLLHGHSIGFRLVFESDSLDACNWVIDSDGLKAFHDWAKYTFDHTLLIARDDPHIDLFKSWADLGLQGRGGICDLRILEDGVGCEKFAQLAYEEMSRILRKFQDDEHYEFTDYRTGKVHGYSIGYLMNEQVRLRSVEVFEHAGSSATYEE